MWGVHFPSSSPAEEGQRPDLLRWEVVKNTNKGQLSPAKTAALGPGITRYELTYVGLAGLKGRIISIDIGEDLLLNELPFNGKLDHSRACILVCLKVESRLFRTIIRACI